MGQTAQGVTSFSDPNTRERRHDGDRNALWCVVSVHLIFSRSLKKLVYAGHLLFQSLL
jgi:hypothetical protein